MTDQQQQQEREQPIVNAYVAVRISMEDLARLTPEQSRAVLVGIAQVSEACHDR